MKYVSCFVASFLAFFIGGSESKDVFRFANIYGSHMVLQRAPKQATIWGFGESGQQVTLRLDKTYRTTVKSGNHSTTSCTEFCLV